MKVYVLIENSKKKNAAFIAEHGLCLYFESGGKRILFDTGASNAFIYNATLHGIDLSKVDICVISHAHSDHTGGLAYFLEINKHARVYIKSAANGDFYIKRFLRSEKASFDSVIFEKYSDRINFIDEDTEIARGVFAANIKKYRQYPRCSAMMYKSQQGQMARDDLAHELFVSVNTKEGQVVVTGCSHHGIINILMTADQKFGRIYGVIGGFHLNGMRCYGFRRKKEPAAEIRAIAKYLNTNKIKKVYTGHCTGEKQYEKLELLARAKKIHAGDIIEI